MVTFAKPEPVSSARSHDKFSELLPSMRAQARYAFRNLTPNARTDATQEVVVLAFVMFGNLVRAGRAHLAFATPLVQYAIRQYRVGRRVGIPINCNDVTSEQAQRARGFKLKSLDRCESATGEWREVLVEDRRAGPAETAAARIDLTTWYRSLPVRNRKLAKVLATGETTGAVAKKFKVSAGRISQVRRELEQSWVAYQAEPVAA